MARRPQTSATNDEADRDPPKDPKELPEASRLTGDDVDAGDDPLALIGDPEGSILIVKLCRRRFEREGTLDALREWEAVLEEVVTLRLQERVAREWLRKELIELGRVKHRLAHVRPAVRDAIKAARNKVSAGKLAEIEERVDAKLAGRGFTVEAEVR